MNTLLIWDIDGTLIQGGGVGKRAMDRAFLELYGVADGFRSIDMAGRLDAMILKNAFEFYDIRVKDCTEFFDRYCQYLQEEIKKQNSPFAVPGIPELLGILDRKSLFYNVLGTGNIEKGARIKLDNDGLNKYFSTGGFGDEPMERWQVIEKAVHNAAGFFNTSFEKENIYVIGDTEKDIECGKKLSVKTIGIAKGPYSAAELISFGADYAFDDLTDIHAFIDIFD